VVIDQPAWEILAEGIVLPVQVHAGARRSGVTGVRQGRLLVAVTQAPEKGKANEALIDVLADNLGLRRRQIVLLTGETSPKKRLLIRDAELSVLAARVANALG
jgi:uncharacterized protein (TIGR00251 family)